MLPTLSLYRFLLAIFTNFILSYLWYSPVLFGHHRVRLLGFTQKLLKDRKHHGTFIHLSTLIFSAIQVLILDIFFELFFVETPWDAIGLAVLLWIGFTAPTYLSLRFFNTKPFSLHLFLIDGSYHLASLVLLALIITF